MEIDLTKNPVDSTSKFPGNYSLPLDTRADLFTDPLIEYNLTLEINILRAMLADHLYIMTDIKEDEKLTNKFINNSKRIESIINSIFTCAGRHSQIKERLSKTYELQEKEYLLSYVLAFKNFIIEYAETLEDTTLTDKIGEIVSQAMDSAFFTIDPTLTERK